MPSKGKGDEEGEVYDEEVRHIGCAIHNRLDDDIQSRIGCERLKKAQNKDHKIESKEVPHHFVIVTDAVAHGHDVIQNRRNIWNAHDLLQFKDVQIAASPKFPGWVRLVISIDNY